MTFGFSGWVSNNADTSVDMAYPSYTNVLGTGSKASWQNVLGALSADCYGLFVQVAKTAASATDTSAVLDIGVDTAGGSSYTAKVSDLLVGFADDTNANNGNGGMQQYLLPIKIASGSTVEAMVADMLRPMLKDWLDANLPGIVEEAVRKEVERISRSV